MQPVKFTDVVNWHRLGVIGLIVIAVTCLGLSHYSHVSILNKTSGSTSFNWNAVNLEMWSGIISSLAALIAAWRGTSGKEAVSLNKQEPAKATENETVAVLLQKIENRCRQDLANAVLNAGGTR